MPIVGAALVPNSPLLLPGLKSQVRKAVVKTTTALNQLGSELSLRSPDIIFVISSVSSDTKLTKSDWAFLQNQSVTLDYSFLGDFISQQSIKMAVGFTHRLKETLESLFPIPLVSVSNLPYTAGVPLLIFGQSLVDKPLVYLQVPQKIDLENLNLVSQHLYEQLQSSSERVVILAAGELGRVIGTNQVEAKLFNQQFVNFSRQDDWSSIYNFPTELLELSGQSIWSPAVLLKSFLANKKINLNLISFEAPYEAGWLTAEFIY
ncbi:hypothetical protein KKC17_03575 [Patescibacteria group bacterium]|nr:hypothetical protein [Patescibacteria group bacterium]